MVSIIAKKMIYEPLFENGLYVDNINLFEKNKPGKTHVCECRENHDAFFSRTAFMQHIKLKCHQKWLMAFRPTISPLLSPLLAPILSPLLSLPPPLLSPTLPPLSLPPLSLREEQDDEYERTLKEDRRKVQDNFAAIIRESEEIYRVEQEARAKKEELERKRKSISEPGYTFRFIFPDGKKVSYTIHKTRPVSYMRDIVDVYMADHQNIYSYELFMFPNRILDAIHTIEESGIENRSTIYIRSVE
jgi:hypothetical protein